MAMRAGKLRHRLALQNATETDSGTGTGHLDKTWTTYATVWGSIEPLSGRELVEQEQVQSEVTHKTKIRYQSAITSEHRIVFKTRTFQIVTMLNPEERNREIELMLRERK